MDSAVLVKRTIGVFLECNTFKAGNKLKSTTSHPTIGNQVFADKHESLKIDSVPVLLRLPKVSRLRIVMAPLGKAITVESISIDFKNIFPQPSSDYKGLYQGNVDPEWTVGKVANGGYVLALILEACIQFQSTTLHVDPLHVTAHFIKTTQTAPFNVCVRTVNKSSGFTNLTAELFQEGVVKIMAHLIFSINGPNPKDKISLTLNPPSTYARRHPLYTHPSQAIGRPVRYTWKFGSRVRMTEETAILSRNAIHSPHRTNSSTIGGGGLNWGAWFEFTDENEKITNPVLCFLVDTFFNTPSLLPKSERVGLKTSWFPTMTLSMEFKEKIPSSSSVHAARTVGLYSSGSFINHPQGRHDIYVEVWTAPSAIGEGEVAPNWRENQVCLAVATQMALTVPMEVNERKAKENSKL